MRKNIQLKASPKIFVGEAPAINVSGVCAQAEAIKDKFRSPFGFVGPKRSREGAKGAKVC